MKESEQTPSGPEQVNVETESGANSSSFHAFYIILRNRVLSGFLLALPIFLTFIIMGWVYRRIVLWVLGPIYKLVVHVWPNGDALEVTPSVLPWWIEYLAAPLVTIAIFIGLLFLLGMFFKSRVHHTLDWVLLHVPVVNWVYSVALKVVNTMQSGDAKKPRFKRVVLVQFPHSGMKAPAFVTNTCLDEATGKTILCVYVPTTPVPTSGYMLLVPEEEVTELSWDLQETLEAIVSGGVTAPPRVEYFSLPTNESTS